GRGGGPAGENRIGGRTEWKRGPRKSAPAFRLRQQPPPLPTPVSRLPGAERDSRGLEARGSASGANRAVRAAAVRHHSLFLRSSLNRRSSSASWIDIAPGRCPPSCSSAGRKLALLSATDICLLRGRTVW